MGECFISIFSTNFRLYCFLRDGLVVVGHDCYPVRGCIMSHKWRYYLNFTHYVIHRHSWHIHNAVQAQNLQINWRNVCTHVYKQYRWEKFSAIVEQLIKLLYCIHVHTMFSLIRCCKLNITRCLLITDVLLQAGKASSAAFTALFISSCVLHGTLLITSLVACIVGKLYAHRIKVLLTIMCICISDHKTYSTIK